VTSLVESRLCDSVIRSLVDLISLRARYPNDPLFDTDHQQLKAVGVRWMADCHADEEASNSSRRQLEVNALLAVTDLVVFNSSLQYLWTTDSYAAYINPYFKLITVAEWGSERTLSAVVVLVIGIELESRAHMSEHVSERLTP